MTEYTTEQQALVDQANQMEAAMVDLTRTLDKPREETQHIPDIEIAMMENQYTKMAEVYRILLGRIRLFDPTIDNARIKSLR